MPSFSRDGDVQHTTPQLTLKYAYDRISGEGARASCEDRTPGDEREDGRASHEDGASPDGRASSEDRSPSAGRASREDMASYNRRASRESASGNRRASREDRASDKGGRDLGKGRASPREWGTSGESIV